MNILEITQNDIQIGEKPLTLSSVFDLETGLYLDEKIKEFDSGKPLFLLFNCISVDSCIRKIILREKTFLLEQAIAWLKETLNADYSILAVSQEDNEDEVLSRLSACDSFLAVEPQLINSEPEHLKKLALRLLKSEQKAGDNEFFEKDNLSFELLHINLETMINIGLKLAGSEKDIVLLHEAKKDAFIQASLEMPVKEVIGGEYKFALLNGVAGTLILPSDSEKTIKDVICTPIPTGELQIYTDKDCTVHVSENFSDTMYKNSCGKCAVCREGLYQSYLFMKDIGAKKGRMSDPEVMKRFLSCGEITGACPFGKRTTKILNQLLCVDSEEVRTHIDRKRCPNLCCPAMFSAYIDPATCIGCGKCKEVCPKQAIQGEHDMIHVIDQNLCDRCMKCEEVCPKSSLIHAGVQKPSVPEKPIPVGTFVAKKKGLMRKRRNIPNH